MPTASSVVASVAHHLLI